MRRLLLDASAVLAVLLAEQQRQAIVGATRGAEISSPGCLSWEVGNALSALMKRKRLMVADAKRLLDQFSGISMRYVEVDFKSALDTSSSCGVYVYDAYYLECARRLRLPLLTLDAGMKAAADTLGIEMIEVV